MKFYIFILIFLIQFPIQAFDRVKLIGDITIATGTKFKETEIGGLSSIVYDKKNNSLLAISDDKSIVNNARFYEFEFTLTEKFFTIAPKNVVTLLDKSEIPFKKHSVDFEGITIFNDSIIIASEGGINREPPIPSALFHFSREGKLIEMLDVPNKYLPPAIGEDKKHGPRDNLAFEALSTTQDGKTFFVGMEESLLQDGNISTTLKNSLTRIIKYQDQKPTKEYLYPLDLVPSIPVAGLTVGETGLVDIAAIDENTFYTLERAYLPLAKKHIIKIFKVTNLEKATDVSKIESVLINKDLTVLKKEIILNLDSIVEELKDTNKSLDNIEGICFGPVLANGHSTLVLVSDNNFNKNQKTQFLAFELIP